MCCTGKRKSWGPELKKAVVQTCIDYYGGVLPTLQQREVRPSFSDVLKKLLRDRSMGATIWEGLERQHIANFWKQAVNFVDKPSHRGIPWQEAWTHTDTRRGRCPTFPHHFVSALARDFHRYLENPHSGMYIHISSTHMAGLCFLCLAVVSHAALVPSHPFTGISYKFMRQWLIRRIDQEPQYRSKLACNGGSHRLQMSWIYRFARRHKISLRVGTTNNRALPVDWEHQGKLFQARLSYLVHKSPLLRTGESIPEELVVNFDQTALRYVPTPAKTLAKKGAKNVPILGLSDKRQCTGVTASSAKGSILPLQVRCVHAWGSHSVMPQIRSCVLAAGYVCTGDSGGQIKAFTPAGGASRAG